MALDIPGRAAVASPLHTARVLVDTSIGLVVELLSVPGRLLRLLAAAENLVARVERLVARIDATTTQATVVVAGAADTLASTRTVADDAAILVAQASGLSHEAQRLLALYSPTADRAAPLAAQFVEELEVREITAAIRLVDRLPEITDRVEGLMPILATLESVAPEIHEILSVLEDVRQAVNGVPGFNYFRRRGESR